MVLYCGGGARSALACKSLAEMGYDKVENLDGGWGSLGQVRSAGRAGPLSHPPEAVRGAW